ncbi:MAG TPA: DUF6165 family protein, partial [Myxococcota bacterium]|nr:DUF6165 family protein [Myxococcota bacterium]
MILHAPTSVGDALDRLTILAIKGDRVRDPLQLSNVKREYTVLREAWLQASLPEPETLESFRLLREVNEQLWDVEDHLRMLEAAGRFDAVFVAKARAVYQTNDRRAALKKRVNLDFGSAL